MMRKHTLIFFALLLGAGLSGIAQENNRYMTLIASEQSGPSPDGTVPDGSVTVPRDGAMPDGSVTVPRDGTINVPGNENVIIYGEASVITPEDETVSTVGNETASTIGNENPSTVGNETFSMIGNRFESVPRDGSIREGYIDAYLELKRGVDENVAEPEDWKANTRIGLSNKEVARMIVINPNPVVDRFHLKIPAEVGEVKQAGFYNMEGRRVRSFGSHIGDGKDHDLEMDATDLIPGLYFLRIENEAGIISKSFEVRDFE